MRSLRSFLRWRPPPLPSGTLQRGRRPRRGAAAPKLTPAAALETHPLIARLTQLPNGAGILVGEPLSAAGTPASVTNLGAGCGRWLHLIAGGQAELDRTPLWTSADRLRSELRKPRLQLTVADLPFTARATGVTHVALGEIAAKEATVTLTYRLSDTATTRVVAGPFVLEGTPDAVVKHPHNYLLHTANTYHRALAGTTAEARTAAETAVPCAAGNTAVWRLLSARISAQACEIRQGRTIGEMTPKELAACERFYADELPADLKAATLDDRSVAAWQDVSSSAAFLGVPELADGAFNKAFALDPTNSELLWWGLELYQPKWQCDPKKLRQVAEAALAASGGWFPSERVNLAISVRQVRSADLWQKIVRTEAERKEVDAYFRKYPELN